MRDELGDALIDTIIQVYKSLDLELEDNKIAEAIYRVFALKSLVPSKKGFLANSLGMLADFSAIMTNSSIGGLKARLRAISFLRRLRFNSNFDGDFYNLQLLASGIERPKDAWRHFYFEGYKLGFDPNIGFNTSHYLHSYPDVLSNNLNPYLHYLNSGAKEGRRVEPSHKIAEIVRSITQQNKLGRGINIKALLDVKDIKSLALGDLIIDENGKHDWKLLNDKSVKLSEFGLYDFRPNDDIVPVINDGKWFLEKFKLLSANPDYEAALKSINYNQFFKNSKPLVSIIVPIYGQLAYTLNCLDSLVKLKTNLSFEIIIGDDCSPDESVIILSKINNINIVSHDHNQGFIGNCNESVKHSKGRFIVLLNNDTRVCDYWLDKLIEPLMNNPEIGMTGSKLFYPDGSLQEAGGIVWADGSAWNYGRNDDPNRPRYCYSRDVDYVSGASIAIEKVFWNEIGGFDEIYRPAYYEDNDFAFMVRAHGKKVHYCANSHVIHYEGKTSGTDIKSGTKSYQIINQRKFYDKWQKTIETHNENGVNVWKERDRNKTKRVLIVDACNPTPWADAGSVATVNLIKQYQALGYHVSFVPEDNFLYQKREVDYLQDLGVECFYAPYEISMTGLLSRYGKAYDIVHLIRFSVAHKNIELIKKYSPQAKILFLNADLHYLRIQRQAELENSEELREKSEAMKLNEIEVIKNVDVTMVHSYFEKDLLEKNIEGVKIVYTPLIERLYDTITPPISRFDVMFLGGYNHPPNLDAAKWLINDIWPKLKPQIDSAARLLIVGSNPPEELKAFSSDDIVITGSVPELSPWFERTKLFIASLRYGAGAKGKILASLGHGVPVIATSIASEGMPFAEGKNIFTIDDIDEIISKAVEIYKLPPKDWLQLSKNAKDHIGDLHSFDAGLKSLEEALSFN